MSAPLRLAGTKVLFVITKSNWGGAQAYTFALARAVRDAGGEAIVALGGTGAAGADAGLLAEKLKAEGIRIVFLRSFMRDVSVLKEFSAFWSLVKLFRAEAPDVVHLNSSKAGGLGALAARVAGVPLIVFTAHGWAHREPRPAFARALIRFASWATVALCNRVVVVSDLDRRDSPALFFERKIVLVPNGIAPFEMLPKDVARAELGSSARSRETPWIFAIAELHPNKGIDVLIRALAKVEDPRAEVVVLGAGQEEKRLRALAEAEGIAKRVHLLGFVPNARRYLKAADIYALPSRKEGMPLALLEAGLAELPVVATRVGGMPEVVMHGVTGLLVPPNDPELFAAAVDALLSDEKLRATLAGNLHHRVLGGFSEEEMIEKTFALYATNS